MRQIKCRGVTILVRKDYIEKCLNISRFICEIVPQIK